MGLISRLFIRGFSTLALAASVMLVSSQHLHAQDTKEITLFTMQLKPKFTDYMEAMLANFEKAHPGTKVKWVDYPAQGYETKLLSMIVGGQSPDVLNLPLQYVITLNDRKLLLPLDDLLTPDQRAQYIQPILEEGCLIKGILYSVPWYVTSPVTMYNKKLFAEAGLDPEKPPKDLDELFSMSRTIKEKTGAFGFLNPLTEDGAFKSIIAAAGVPLTDAAMTKATFNTPEALRVVKQYKQMFDDGVIPRESLTAEHRRAIDLFKTGKAAFFVSGAQFLLGIKEEAPDMYANVGIGNMPPIPPDGRYLVELQNLSVYAKTRHPREATDLALWITNAENQLAFAKIVTILPSAAEALKDPYFSLPGNTPEDRARNISAKQLEKPTALIPPLPNLSELNRVMNDFAREVMLRNVPPETALNQAEEKWNAILAKPRRND